MAEQPTKPRTASFVVEFEQVGGPPDDGDYLDDIFEDLLRDTHTIEADEGGVSEWVLVNHYPRARR